VTPTATVSANLATAFSIKGVSYSLSSAHCIGAAADLIGHGAQDITFAGGGEDLHWSMSVMFDAMGALSTGFNATPACASRSYDANRDGFVIAVARGAHIHAELRSCSGPTAKPAGGYRPDHAVCKRLHAPSQRSLAVR